MDIDIVRCILKIIPDWKGIVFENDYAKIKPHELETRLTPSLIELQTVWDSIVKEEVRIDEVRRHRSKAYASVQDQLAMIYDDKVNGTNTWQEHIASVKMKYLKF
ncbi:MAG: hypothetical protein Q8P28_04275 [Deltaproteobacteria bacterium]|nr:hypothetical protein [Deltaproteobacteria bacterium]